MTDTPSILALTFLASEILLHSKEEGEGGKGLFCRAGSNLYKHLILGDFFISRFLTVKIKRSLEI